MKLIDCIHAETMVSDKKSEDPRKTNLLLQVHFNKVQDIVKSIRDSGNIIKMTNQAQSMKRKGGEEIAGYQTVIYHGITGTPDRKTFIQTRADGSSRIWVEPLVI